MLKGSHIPPTMMWVGSFLKTECQNALGPEAVISGTPDMSRYNQVVDAILVRLTADAGNVQYGVYMLLAGRSSGFSALSATY